MHLLRITFDVPLDRHHIIGFRAAVARAAGFENDVFHNHKPDGMVEYRYPLVQYRSERGRAAILGIDEGGEAIYRWFKAAEGRLLWNEAEHQLHIVRMDAHEYALKYHLEPGTYRLRQWIALNQERYREWQQLPSLTARAKILEQTLVANILTFCRAVQWRLPERLEVNITDILATYPTRLEDKTHIAFDVAFKSNLQLPFGIGLGKSVSRGYGVCKPLVRKG